MRLKSQITEKQSTLFPESVKDTPWETNTTVKRYYLQFPYYPFRTLNTRDLTGLGPISEFNSSSPIFPANTQININFKRRNMESLLNFMLPYNLNYKKGSSAASLTLAERTTALTFSVPNAAAVAPAAPFKDYVITGVEIVLKDIYLQVWGRKTKFFWYSITLMVFPFRCVA